MPVIKRYPNRKLYNTETKQYITLDGIARLIRTGEEVQVVDHKSGEDLTPLTLSQIIFEQEKKQGGFLPKSVLTSLVKTGGSTANSLWGTITSPVERLRQTDLEIERRVSEMINRGEIAREEGLRLRDRLLSFGRRSPEEEEPSASSEEIQRILEAQGVPTRTELNALQSQIDKLIAKLDETDAD